ncbi:flagellar biosynthesis anti-sigma factor FlgM [Pelorhabdus rhamnosifermentans]|uniref:flagellar biosynthesis anti-sigma factor FlgM n=1 Tax=Pelorhabdus rhamnosifermentans TaxID=2772457 RepID=UPI001FEB6353|nr:flagellar biosynthesis anti-sigma factor FlgM [Pelorhabdus rhamnosifermentans]
MIILASLNQQAMKAYSGINKTLKAAKTNTQEVDEVVLPLTAQKFSRMLCDLKALSDVRRDRVQSISDRVARGTYHVDATTIADKMLSNTLNKNE